MVAGRVRQEVAHEGLNNIAIARDGYNMVPYDRKSLRAGLAEVGLDSTAKPV